MAHQLQWTPVEFDWHWLYKTLARATKSMDEAMSIGAALATSFGRVPRGTAADMAYSAC